MTLLGPQPVRSPAEATPSDGYGIEIGLLIDVYRVTGAPPSRRSTSASASTATARCTSRPHADAVLDAVLTRTDQNC